MTCDMATKPLYDKPTVSIVLPTYNGSRFLQQSLDSCLNQTMPDWELIAVDDCSTDETPSILRRVAEKDARIRVFRNEKNLRLPRSLNRGFEEAKGDFFTWTSDDNLFEANALEVMLAKLREGFDFVYAGQHIIDDENSVVGEHIMGEPHELPFRNVVNACFLYRRAIHDRLGGYDPNRFLVEDYDFWLRARHEFRFSSAPGMLYRYRRHGGSLSSTRRRDAALALAKVLEERSALDFPRGYSRAEHRLYVAHLYGLQNAKLRQLKNVLRAFGNSPKAAWGPKRRWLAKLLVTSVVPGTRYSCDAK